MEKKDCTCLEIPFNSRYEIHNIGVDETNGRYGEVRLYVCKKCHRNWLYYSVEYEAFKGSGRWYLGLITEETAKTVTPENAVEILEGLKWHFYGGSYFNTSWEKGSGNIFVDLY